MDLKNMIFMIHSKVKKMKNSEVIRMALEVLGHILFFTIGLVVGASIMYFGGLIIDRKNGD